MSRKLPPLNALRAFEASARHLSYTAAARELCVTQGAVSRHVATLEGWLRTRLFARQGRGIALTPQGSAYFRAATSALDLLEQASRQIQLHPDEMRLRIEMPPTFAIRWLMPRLARFHALHRDIDVQVTTSYRIADLARDDVDISIHSSLPQDAQANCRLLFAEELTPVCAPGVLRGTALRKPADLAKHALLSSVNRPLDWPTWLKAAGVKVEDGNTGLRFENTALALQAALEGLGVVMAQPALVMDDLKAGRLIAPFELRVPTEAAYYMASLPSRAETARVRAFESWIVGEVTAMNDAAGRAPRGAGEQREVAAAAKKTPRKD